MEGDGEGLHGKRANSKKRRGGVPGRQYLALVRLEGRVSIGIVIR